MRSGICLKGEEVDVGGNKPEVAMSSWPGG